MDSFVGAIVKLAVWVGVLLAIVAGVLHMFYVRIAVISEDNMAPTMLAGERIVLWRNAELAPSDIAVCKHPTRDQYVIGRVIATAGMVISSDRSNLYIVNGLRPTFESKGTIDFLDQHSGHHVPMQWGTVVYAGHEHSWMMRPRDRVRIPTTKVGNGIYLLSDNRSFHGADSRSFGEIDPSTCLGQVFFRLQPAHPPREDVVHGWMQFVK